jgi:putative heme-binding domain-containing protein
MSGFDSAYAGRPLVGLPDELAKALATYAGQSVTFGLRQGKPEALTQALRTLADAHADRNKQLDLLQVLSEVRRPACVPVLLDLACKSSDNNLRSAALAALGGYGDPTIPVQVIKAHSNMSDDVSAAAENLLVSRRSWAYQFLDAIEAGSIDRRTVPREVVERLFSFDDARIAAQATHLFGAIKPATSPDLRSRVDRFAAVIRAGTGVPKPGKQIFETACLRCHALFGTGGRVGPDLTTYRRDDLETMLLNIVNPSADVREGYTASVIATIDGRLLTGMIVEQDKNVLRLRVSDGTEVTLPRDEIEAIRPSPTSIMPEGLLNDMNDQQVRDLFAYLRSTQPLID